MLIMIAVFPGLAQKDQRRRKASCWRREANKEEVVTLHCQEEGCIGKYPPPPPRIERFAEAGILRHEVRDIAKGKAWGLFWEIRMFSYFKGYFEGYFKGYFEGWGVRNPHAWLFKGYFEGWGVRNHCWGKSRSQREVYFQLIPTRGGVLAFFFSREGMYWKYNPY